MSSDLILIFAYYYPPENVIGAARPARFAKYLARLGYECRVFTASPQFGRCDPNTVYIPDPFLIRERSSLRWQLERAVRKTLLPGERGMQWSFYAARAARNYVRSHPAKRTTIFSTLPPLGPHLAALQLARSEGLPWIADFRDPFPEASEDVNFYPMQMRIYRWLERVTARRSSAIISNTDAASDRWRAKFPTMQSTVHTVWNGFDPEQRIMPLATAPRDFRTLSHTGELYGGRTAKPVLESIARLIAAGRLSSNGIRVRLIGAANAEALPDQDFLTRARAAGWLELVARKIPQPEALDIARSSDQLLLIQLPSAVHVPAKIFEYLQIGRPILAFVQQNSPSEVILRRSGVPYRCVYPESSPEVVDNNVAEFFSLPSTTVRASDWFEDQFNAENQTLQLDAIVRSLHKDAVQAAHSVPPHAASPTSTKVKKQVEVSE